VAGTSTGLLHYLAKFKNRDGQLNLEHGNMPLKSAAIATVKFHKVV